jgi:hypothetical protein
VTCYEKAVIKGVKISCRGRQFAETLNTDHHDLHQCWNVKRQYRSWFRLQDYFIKRSYDNSRKRGARTEISREIVQSTMFGQLDYCFRLNIPGEPFIHGLAMGHCSLRACSYSDKRWQHWVDPAVQPKRVDTFVCLNYIDSTAIGVRYLFYFPYTYFCSWLSNFITTVQLRRKESQ